MRKLSDSIHFIRRLIGGGLAALLANGCQTPVSVQTNIAPVAQVAQIAPPAPQSDTTRPATTAPAGNSIEDARSILPYLAGDQLAGRGAGSPGLDRASDFLVEQLKKLNVPSAPGLVDYSQPLEFRMASAPSPSTHFSINDKPLVLGVDFNPLSISGEGAFAGKVMFLGYGISRQGQATRPAATVPATRPSRAGREYDDYAGVDVKGKILLVMRQEPQDEAGNSLLAEADQKWSPAAVFNAKARSAAEHGAAALLLVTPPSVKDSDTLMPFVGDMTPGGSPAKLPVLQVTRRVADLLLAGAGEKNLATLEDEINHTLHPRAALLRDTELAGDVALNIRTAKVRNIVAMLPGTGPTGDEFVVIGAHYDHLGKGELGHMFGKPGSIFYGADDNASGTTAVLQLAERLARQGRPARSILFCFFTAEEEGLIGSQYFVQHPPVPLEKMVAMLNLDMVGRLKDNSVLVGGWGTAPAFDALIKKALAGSSLSYKSFERGGLGPSDHMSFALKKIPVLFFFTGLHADYHRPTDTADKINYDGMTSIVDISQRLVTELTTMPKQTYDGSADAHSTMAFSSDQPGSRRASLGVVPDYAAVDSRNGVAIAGVSDGSPAEKAGLKAGDVLQKWNGRALDNLQDLSDMLAEAKPGDAVVIRVLRQDKTLDVKAILAERK